MMTKTLPHILCCLSLVCSVGWNQQSLAEDLERQDPTSLQALEAKLNMLRTRHNIPTLAVSLTSKPHSSQFITLGLDPNTPLRWGSITKIITGLCILKLAEQKLIDLHAPLADYVDQNQWQNKWRSTHPVRVIHLIELTAGFTDISREEFDHNKPISLVQALALNPAHRRTLWPPGLQHSYSNMVPGLSQLLIETITGKQFEQAAFDLVLTPLGFTDASFTANNKLPGGFEADGKTPLPYWHMTFPAYGALNASIADVTKLMHGILGRGQLSAWQIQHLLVPRSSLASRQGFMFEYAAHFYGRIRSGHLWHNHGGDADGYRSRLAILTHPRRGYIASINTDNPRALRQIEVELENYLTADMTKPSPPKPAVMDAAKLGAFVGKYYPTSTRFSIEAWLAGTLPVLEISIADNQQTLLAKTSKRTVELFAVTQTTFRRAHEPTATVSFNKTGSQLYLQGVLGNFARLDNCPSFLSQDACNL